MFAAKRCAVEALVDAGGRAIGEHSGHASSGEARVGRVLWVVVAPVVLGVRHDRKSFSLAYRV